MSCNFLLKKLFWVFFCFVKNYIPVLSNATFYYTNLLGMEVKHNNL